MGPLTQTVKSIVSETHMYQSKQWNLTQTVKSIVSETHIYQSKQWDLLHKLQYLLFLKPIFIVNNGTSYTNWKIYCFRYPYL